MWRDGTDNGGLKWSRYATCTQYTDSMDYDSSRLKDLPQQVMIKRLSLTVVMIIQGTMPNFRKCMTYQGNRASRCTCGCGECCAQL
jgi:hypothetical protein